MSNEMDMTAEEKIVELREETEKLGAPKEIILETGGVEYHLAYTRDAIKKMEALGFSMKNFDDKIVTSIDTVFRGAFYKNHRSLSDARVSEILDSIYAEYDTSEIIPILIEMITEAMPQLKAKDPEANVKNFKVVRG